MRAIIRTLPLFLGVIGVYCLVLAMVPGRLEHHTSNLGFSVLFLLGTPLLLMGLFILAGYEIYQIFRRKQNNRNLLRASGVNSLLIRWLLNREPRKVKILKTELGIEPIRADSVIFIKADRRILHIEFQTLTTSKPSISFRELDYSVRLIRTYDLPVTQVVVFLQETTNEIAFTEQFVNETTIHNYRSIRMWEQDSNLFLNNEALLPLASLCRTNSPQGLLSQVAQNVARIPDIEKRQDTAAYTEILAGLRFEKNLIRQLLSEDIMQESVIYQDILQKGEKIGEQRGRQLGEQLGEQLGRQQEAFRFLSRQLNRRFGQIDSSIIERIQALSTEQLETLGEEFIDFTDVADLVNWLNQQANI